MITLIRVDSTATTTPAGRNASAVARADHAARLCRYWVTRNWNDTYEPNRVSAPMFARVSAPERKMPSGTSGSRLRRSMVTNAASSTATAANDPMVRAEAHPACWAETTV